MKAVKFVNVKNMKDNDTFFDAHFFHVYSRVKSEFSDLTPVGTK